MSQQFNIDTVENAAATPDTELPWAELGLKQNEYDDVVNVLGRRPTGAELAMYSVMWSEHCSYKSSKNHLRQFGDKVTDEMKKDLLVGIGENAGVTNLGDGWAVTFKIESHNSPSFVEPYQGAATGIGGIVRDIISMGARPVAVMDPLRFGAIDHPDTARVMHGAVAGIGGYGNSLGLPNIGGEMVFDPVYQGNPLVNALAVGVMRHEDIRLANASGKGNKVVLFGARTGGDGIGGASVLASESFDATKPSKRPAVQVGDPFAEKVLIECCLELFKASLVEGIQDLGAAGISCATSELASNGDGGMRVELTNVLLRDPTLTPGEILMSESQERMMAVVSPENLEAFEAVMDKWAVEYSWLGEVTDTERLVITWDDEVIVDVDPRTVAHDGPVYDRPYARPDWQDALQADTFRASPAGLTLPSLGEELKDAVLELVASPNMCDKSWITNQFDRYVGGNTALASPDDAGVVRVDEETGMGVALATDANGRYAYLDPYHGSQLALAEAFRNVATTGAVPLAVSDCLNFGSPEDPDVMWQLAEAIRGLSDACMELGIPVTGGNVSLYNQTGTTPIHPSPVVAVLGRFDDVARRTPSGWHSSADGQAIYLMGTTADELDGSEFANLRGHLGGLPPTVDLAAEKLLGDLLVNASRDGMIDAAHDLSEGGLAAALVEMSLRYGVGARVALQDLCDRDGVDVFTALFSESQARAVVAVPRSEEVRFKDMTTARDFPVVRLGIVDAASDSLDIQGQFSATLEELRTAHEGTLPKYF
ncbi:MAG: phosphoribosylformylglycinamidine synthase subunit PurL [Arthrobacter sp.]|uniref:phosphoribosylformylglycinamidine synthase subunit PurL n=1 Tax=unclassified Arthrobacter TaxID=235627 RepID=UPI002655B02D|nr:phosphoribosylformylglycinamidine synthase subunit PurL [Micrococcaceae bacterium]MDN5879982.1 phosphoribosylformylglycinamidine synthase subunit PurL [Micrococcaceae bacterium]MDN5886470.1 phosphoribosylformylglycinamidine synthase subunit PurL [Micrococcaceae bacterium]MDN6168699.1 phosphoribosylformylglycinamidine synthase subunit PurL [Micrococcaceae bacterium]